MNEADPPKLTREDFVHALQEMGSFIDITVEDLMRIDALAHEHARLRQAGTTRIRDLMTAPVITVHPDASLAEAARLLLEHRIAGLPVVDDSGTLVGVVTEADFLRTIGIPHHHATQTVWHSLEAMFQHKPRRGGLEAKVSDVMVKDVVTATEDQTLHDAIELMKKHRIKRLIVADRERQVRGIVTRSDLVKLFLAP